MSYPKPVTLRSLTAGSERLLVAKADPTQPRWAENLAHAVMDGSPEPADWSERQMARPPCFLECTLGEIPAQFDLDGAVWIRWRDAQ
jgi:hypothetical protein